MTVAMIPLDEARKIIAKDTVLFDPQSRFIANKTIEAQLSLGESLIFKRLVSERDRVVSLRKLEELPHSSRQKKSCTNGTYDVRMAISRLRKRLRTLHPDLTITPIRSVGYRFLRQGPEVVFWPHKNVG